jgi:hypothetical protein
MAVTMVCIGIPICRPLYKEYLDKWTSKDGSKYKENSAGGYRLQAFRAGEIHHDNCAPSGGSLVNDGEHGLGADRNLGPGGPNSMAYAIGGSYPGDNQSEEEILGLNFQQSQQRRTDDDRLEKGSL